jgi:hypothetical protein
VFRGAAAVQAEVARVGGAFSRNRLESRALLARTRGELGWFSDSVWWSGLAAEDGPGSEGAAGGAPAPRPFASLTRWTGVCLRLPGGWKLLLLHVSEEV